MTDTKATSFRVVVESDAKINLLNALVWPANVYVRDWDYSLKLKPKTNAGAAAVGSSRINTPGVPNSVEKSPKERPKLMAKDTRETTGKPTG
jgi:hypothetical protein